MAGDWIKMRTDLIDDPAVIRVCSITGAAENAVVGSLHRLWSWADRHTQDGVLRGVDRAWVDRHVLLPGFAEAMIAAGWMVEIDGELALPDFTRHNGASAKARANAAYRQQKHRVQDDVSRSAVTNVTGARDKNVTREEKRREEKNREEAKTENADRSEPGKPGPSPAATWGHGRIVFRVDSAEWEGITDVDRRAWATAYPAVDIDRQLAAAAAWVRANPSKGRKSNYGRFLASWLSREQDRGGTPLGASNGRTRAAEIHAARSTREFED